MCDLLESGLFDPTSGPVSLEARDFFVSYYTDDEVNRSTIDADETLRERLIEHRGLEPHQAHLFAAFARDKVIQELFG